MMENLDRENGLRRHRIPSLHHKIILKRSHLVFTVHCFTLDFLRHWLQLTGSIPFFLPVSWSHLNQFAFLRPFLYCCYFTFFECCFCWFFFLLSIHRDFLGFLLLLFFSRSNITTTLCWHRYDFRFIFSISFVLCWINMIIILRFSTFYASEYEMRMDIKGFGAIN